MTRISYFFLQKITEYYGVFQLVYRVYLIRLTRYGHIFDTTPLLLVSKKDIYLNFHYKNIFCFQEYHPIIDASPQEL